MIQTIGPPKNAMINKRTRNTIRSNSRFLTSQFIGPGPASSRAPAGPSEVLGDLFIGNQFCRNLFGWGGANFSVVERGKQRRVTEVLISQAQALSIGAARPDHSTQRRVNRGRRDRA